jgi:hypothetical protein
MSSSTKLIDPMLAAIEQETSSVNLVRLSEECLFIAAVAGLKSIGVPVTAPAQRRLVSQLVLALAKEEQVQLTSSGLKEYDNTLH